MNLTDTIDIKVTAYEKKGRKRVAVVKTKTVPAKHYGPLALHHDVQQYMGRGKSRQLWKVSHRATGLRIVGELPLDQARDIAKRIKDMPEWWDRRIGDGRTAETAALFDKLQIAVLEVKSFVCGGGRPLAMSTGRAA